MTVYSGMIKGQTQIPGASAAIYVRSAFGQCDGKITLNNVHCGNAKEVKEADKPFFAKSI